MHSTPSFTKLPNDSWGVRIYHGRNSCPYGSGDEVTVVKRNGGQSHVKLGPVAHRSHDRTIFSLMRDPKKPAASNTANRIVQVDQPGVYEVDGTVYIVKPTRDKSRMYAKRLVEIGGNRLTEADTVVQIDFEYEAGAIYKIRPEHKMPLERAETLTTRYGRCIVCGAYLKDATSVKRGIGPVCIKSFA